jgi:hypothetical protein
VAYPEVADGVDHGRLHCRVEPIVPLADAPGAQRLTKVGVSMCTISKLGNSAAEMNA